MKAHMEVVQEIESFERFVRQFTVSDLLLMILKCHCLTHLPE